MGLMSNHMSKHLCNAHGLTSSARKDDCAQPYILCELLLILSQIVFVLRPRLCLFSLMGMGLPKAT